MRIYWDEILNRDSLNKKIMKNKIKAKVIKYKGSLFIDVDNKNMGAWSMPVLKEEITAIKEACERYLNK